MPADFSVPNWQKLLWQKVLRFTLAIAKINPSYGFPVSFDISELNQIEKAFATANPDIVVHAASMTDVDKCELNKELAWKINVEGAKNIAEATAKSGAFLVYISTDYVFSGEKGCYKEIDQTGPINH